MILLVFSTIILSLCCTGGKSDVSVYSLGAKVIFTNVKDQSVITVHPNGKVTTEPFADSPEQKWLILQHPSEPDALEFVQEEVPYNDLSGFEDPPENPGIYPRPLSLANRGYIGNVKTWNIRIRRRWCLQTQGVGQKLDIDDCEDFTAPWQLWQIEEVSIIN